MNSTFVRGFVIYFVSIAILTLLASGVFLKRSSAQDNQQQQQELKTTTTAGTESDPRLVPELGIPYTFRYSIGAPTFLSFYSGMAETSGSHWFEWRLQSFKIGEFLFNLAWMIVLAAVLTMLFKPKHSGNSVTQGTMQVKE